MDNRKKAKQYEPISDPDFQYLNQRDCSNVQLDITDEFFLGFNQDPFDCLSIIDWFKDGTSDFSTVEAELPEMSLESSEVSSSSVFVETERSKITESGSIPILMKWGSRLVQWIINFNANEYTSGREGKGLVALSNGGVHLRREITFNKGKANEYKLVFSAINAKFENWLDPIVGEITSETTFDLNILIERWNIIQATGTVPDGFGLPSTSSNVTIDYTDATLTDTEVTVNGLTITDLDGLSDGNIYIRTYGSDGLTLDEQIVVDGADYVFNSDFTAVENVFVSINWKLSETLMYATAILNVEKTVTLPLPPKKAKKGE